MLYLLVILLGLIRFEAPAQSPAYNSLEAQQPIPIANPSIEDRLRELEQQNRGLRNIIQTLEPYREYFGIMQQRIAKIQHDSLYFQRSYEIIRKKMEEDRQQYEALTKEYEEQGDRLEEALTQEKSLANERSTLQQAKKQAEEQVSKDKALAEQSDKALQFLRKKADSLQEEITALRGDYEKAQADLEKSADALSNAKQAAAVNMEAEQDRIAYKKRIDALLRELDETRSRNQTLVLDSASAQQKIDSLTQQLGSTQRDTMQAQNDLEELKNRYKSSLEEKTATINKWRDEYSALQTNLNTAVTINNQLRQEMADLQKQCAAKKP